tara:strand:+ start:26488 stop:27000 length:513 start_codon:yes stop_codon:yes gene_type:complete
MPRKTRTPNSAASDRLAKKIEAPFKLVGAVVTKNAPELVKMQLAENLLVSNDIITRSANKDATGASLKILAGLDITIVEDVNINYSLIHSEMKESSEVTGKQLESMEIKFPSPSDPFYELDDGHPEYAKKQIKATKKYDRKDTTKIVSDLYAANQSKKSRQTKKIKQFAK